jgi:soluble P-type ATPase
MCWIFALSSQVTKYVNSKNYDENINSKKIKTKKDIIVRSDELYIGDNIILNYDDKTPAFLKVNNIKHANEINISNTQKEDFDICFYDDKESTGEEISASFTKGDIIPPHRIITRPNSIIECQIIKYIEPVLFEHQTTTPNFLNKIRFIIDVISIIILGIISLLISSSAISHTNTMMGITTNIDKIKIISKHFFASIISGNVIIPSMKMTLLYNVYNLLLGLSFKNIKINSYDSLLKLENINSAIFDKTGTITEEYLSVYQHYSFNNGSVFEKLLELNWTNDEILFALSIANSESNLYESSESKVYGTSPEENKILEYWYFNKKVNLFFNPIKPSGHVVFQFPDCTEKKIFIKNRNPYNFDNGKISVISIETEKKKFDFVVRQHGTSRFLDNYIKDKKHSSDILHSLCDDDILSLDWAYYITKNDKRRSMSIAISTDEDKWEIISIYTFENPLRKKVNDVMMFFREKNISCSILTGDSRETAEEIAKDAGFPECIYHIMNDDEILNLIGLAKNHKISISIDANLLNNILNEVEKIGELLLNNNNIFKIIYKASKLTKEKIVANTHNSLYLGDAKNDELAIKKAHVGISLKHGADTCKLYSSICISEPYDLIDLLDVNGYKDMLLIGGQKIFKDVCFMGGLICGCLVVGIYSNKFEFTANSLLYKDVWDPLPMLMISSIQYTSSVLGYASSDCKNSKYTINSNVMLGVFSFVNNLCGFVIGIMLSWILKNHLTFFYFDTAILHIINLVILFKHSIHRINSDTMFGNQKISNGNKIIGFSMNIIDSILFRLLLYFVFCIIF